MKKSRISAIFTSLIMASAFLTISTPSSTVTAQDFSNVVQVNVMDGLCTLIDNAATNYQASDYALCFAEAYGTGRTTEDDAVIWEGVTFEKDVKQVAIKCGYNLGGDKAGTGTEFWLYLDKIEGEPIAKVAVNDSETASSQIKDQVLKFADVNIKAGTYDVIVVGKTENSGSFSQVNFMYEPMEEADLVPVADALRAEDVAKAAEIAKKSASATKINKARNEQAEKYGYFDINVKEGECTLIDNAATNHQASDYALCFAEAYGSGRTTEDDAIVWENVVIHENVKMIAVKCGYNLGGDKAGTGTEFWVYLNRIEGNPIAKVSVNDSETASSQIVDQVLKTAYVNIAPGTYDVIVVAKTEYSGSVSQVKFITDNSITDSLSLKAAVEKENYDIKYSAEEERKKEEEKKAKEEEERRAKEAAEKAKEAERRAKEEAEKRAAEERARQEAEAKAEAEAKKESEALELESPDDSRSRYDREYDFDDYFDFDDYDYYDSYYDYYDYDSDSLFGYTHESAPVSTIPRIIFGLLFLIFFIIF